MSYYPIFLDLKGRPCLVVGGGEVAQRKVASLTEAGARVRVVSPSLTPELRSLAENGEIEHQPRPFSSGDLQGVFLAIAATDDPKVNRQVAEAARRAGVLVNVVDEPSQCDFIVPAVLRRGELVIAVSTGGLSPALARRVREELERSFGPEYARLAELVSHLRRELREQGKSPPPQAWQEVLGPEVLELLRRGEEQAALDWLRSKLPAKVGR